MESFQIIFMRYKVVSGTTLDRINREVGVANEIFMGNASNQTGYNTEMPRFTSMPRIDIHTTDPHSTWQNRVASVLKIIRGKAKIKRFQINIPKRVW